MSSVEDDVKIVLEHLGTRCGMTSCSYEIVDGDKQVENYFGIVVPVTVNGLVGGVEKILHVMVKMPLKEAMPAILETNQFLYERELYVYEHLFPHYRSLDTDVNIEQLFPDCYYLNSNLKEAVLVLTDMRYKGFERFTKGKFLDFEHMKVTLRSLAQFHALSIISQESGEVFEKTPLIPYTSENCSHYFNCIKESFDNNSGLFEEIKHQEFLNDIRNNLSSYINCCAARSKVKRLIFGHGDIWRENILFQYENGKPVNACLIDFQGTRHMSPAQDFLNFILASAEPENRRENFKKNLNIYHDALTGCLSRNGHNTELYSRIDLEEDLKYVAPVCFLSNFFAFALWYGLNDKSNLLKSQVDVGSEIIRKKFEEEYKKLIMGIIEDLHYFDLL